jgi:hypothetical protein
MNLRLAATLLCTALVFTGCEKKQPTSSDLYNDAAKLGTTLPYPVLDWKPLATSAGHGAGTTSTLFGNDIAVAASRAGQPYPAGSVLGLVTWQQRDDPHWFGAKIPAQPAQVEFVEVGPTGEKYRSFTGTPLAEQTAAHDRSANILAIKAIVLP